MEWSYIDIDDISIQSSEEIINMVAELKLCPCGGKLEEVNKNHYWFSGNATGIVYECETCLQWWLIDEENTDG